MGNGLLMLDIVTVSPRWVKGLCENLRDEGQGMRDEIGNGRLFALYSGAFIQRVSNGLIHKQVATMPKCCTL